MDGIVDALRQLGFSEGKFEPLGAHHHYYRPEFDKDAANVLRAFDWRRTTLRDEDEQ